MKTMTKFSNKLFLLSVLLLLCSRVAGERAESPQRRRAAIGERATVAPTLLNADEIGKGAKFGKFSKSLPGKGTKSEKSSKIEKKFGKDIGKATGEEAKQENDFKFMKGSKSEKSGGKSSKMAKSGKSTKSPTIPPRTVSPTSADSISSKSSTFAITYSTKEIYSTEDLEELTMMTHTYLEDFMMNFFEKTALTDLDNFLTVIVGDAFVAGEAFAEFQSNGLFNPNSIFIPVTRELDNLIEDAIAQDEYLDMLNSLPRSNPFRETKSIKFTEVDGQTTSGENTSGSSSESSFVRAGVAAAAAGVVVLAAGLAMLKRRRPSLDDDNNDAESFSPRKSAPDDFTSAGDTCTMAVEDASSHFSHWRTAKSHNNGLEGGEFQDEPLDS